MAGISKKRIRTKTGVKVKYVITYRDIFGKQHTSGYYRTQLEAKNDLWKFDEVKESGSVTYGYIFSNFLKKVQTKNSDNTFENYKRYYNMHFKQYDDIEYEKVSSLYWQDFFDNLSKESSPYVAQLCLKMCKAAVNLLIKHDLLEKNVFNKVEPAKLPKADINHLTIEELKNVLEMCFKCYKEYYPLLYTFIGTGAREGELLALEKTDFNIAENYITISKQFYKGKLLNHPKTAHSNRRIYIFKELADVLKEHIKTLAPDNPLLFPNRAGGYIRPENMRRRVFYPLLKLCGINKRVRLHDLRGSYIDMVLSSGLSVKFAQNQAGHSRSETTLNVYARNNDDMINLATNQLNTIFKKCEINVSQKEKTSDKKIIPFRKNRFGIMF